MIVLTANASQLSTAIEVLKDTRITCVNGYAQYSTDNLADYRNGVAVWTDWPPGQVAGSANTVATVMVRLVATADNATLDIETLPKSGSIPVTALWATDDGQLYADGNVEVGPAGGWTVRGNTTYLGPITHTGASGVQAGAGFTLHSCYYSDALLSSVTPVLVTCSTSTAYDVAGFVAAMGTRVDQALGTPGNHMYPDNGAGASGFTDGGAQLQFSGADTVSVGLSDTAAGSQIPNWVVGDSSTDMVQRDTPLADAVNNPKNSYIYHARATGVSSLGYNDPAPSYPAVLTDLAALGMFAEIGPSMRTGFVTRVGGSTLATTGTGTGFTQDWTAGSAPVGLLGTATVPVMNVLFMGDSVAYGAYATATGIAGGGNNCVGYAYTACRQVSTKDFPVNYISTARNSAFSQAACERARRFIAQVMVPDVIVIKPTVNDSYLTADLETLEAECLALGMWVIWMVPNPGNATSVPWNTARNLILTKAGLPRRSVVDYSQTFGNSGVDFSQWAASPGSFVTDPTGIHPNRLGHAVMRESLATALRDLVALASGDPA